VRPTPATDRHVHQQARRRRSLAEVLSAADEGLRRGEGPAAAVWPTGFDALDRALAGGMRSGELVLVAGAQAQGKTTFTVQAMRSVARSGRHAVLFSYEHESGTLLERLIALEAAELADDPALAPGVHGVRRALEAQIAAKSLSEALAGVPYGLEALQAMETYAERLSVHESNPATDLAAIAGIVDELTSTTGEPPLVAIDYLQKVPVPGHEGSEEERLAVIAEALKDLALEYRCPVLAVSAAEKESLGAGHRMRAHHLRGASSLAYEADIVLVLSGKDDIVSREHLVYDLSRLQQFRGFSVFSLEKNRHGLDHVDLEFAKDFANGRYVPHGKLVEERLIEERVITS
jgi:replicative DNA helicase